LDGREGGGTKKRGGDSTFKGKGLLSPGKSSGATPFAEEKKRFHPYKGGKSVMKKGWAVFLRKEERPNFYPSKGGGGKKKGWREGPFSSLIWGRRNLLTLLLTR